MSTVTQNGSIKGFFEFMNERQSIYLKKEAGLPAPWTDDDILRHYYFCNIFREQDTVTKYIKENYRDIFMEQEADLLIWNLVMARFFNWIPTLEIMGTIWKWPRSRPQLLRALQMEYMKGNPIFNSAYLIAGTDLKGKSKVEGVFERLDAAWGMRKHIARTIKVDGTLQGAWSKLQDIPGVAGFIAYEVATDLRHTHVLDKAPDIWTWANAGPGAIRGLKRIYGVMPKKDANQAMWILLDKHAPKWTNLSLEMRDIEHSLCEYDKYLRIKHGQGSLRRYNGTGSKNKKTTNTLRRV